MGSNPVRKEVKFLPLSFFLFFCVFHFWPAGAVQAQNISKTYVASAQPGGVLYFIVPQSGFSDEKSGAKFTYDITYKTSSDTAIVNFSYYDPRDLTIDSISFANGASFGAPATRIFVEPQGKSWHYRYTARLPYAQLKNFYQQAGSQPRLTLYTSTGAARVSIGENAWKDQALRIAKVFKMIELNKQ